MGGSARPRPQPIVRRLPDPRARSHRVFSRGVDETLARVQRQGLWIPRIGNRHCPAQPSSNSSWSAVDCCRAALGANRSGPDSSHGSYRCRCARSGSFPIGIRNETTHTLLASDAGEAIWADLPLGDSRFQVSMLGFNSQRLTVTVRNTDEQTVEAKLAAVPLPGLLKLKRRWWHIFF